MRRLQWILTALVITLVLLVCTPCPPLLAKDKADKDILFRWAFGAMVGPEGDKRMVAITRDTTLKTGDKLKMLVELQSRCFVYLFYRTADDELYLLFPYALDQFEKDYETSKRYYIPEGDMWFELDENQGLETFYLLASAKRLTKLEKLYGEYTAAEGSGKKAEDAVYGREGILGERPEGEIGVTAVRAGDIVGEHTVYFVGNNERIELTHRAHSRDTFARGAITAAKFVCKKGPGLYDMHDVLGMK